MEKRSLKIKLVISALLLLLSVAVAIPSFAWFVKTGIVAYAPVSSNESLYIGAGHIQLTKDGSGSDIFDPAYPFEDVRYLYLEGIDTRSNTDGNAYQDFVFCVYGENISNYKLQLAYTTNNQFTYEIYNAEEWNEEGDIPDGAVRYVAQGHQHTYYYTASGDAISGTYLNDKTTAAGEKLGKDSSDESAYAAPQQYHIQTYGSYNNVQKYAEPIYWQTTLPIQGNARQAFVKYFILRVRENSKRVNDRETDVICIAAKSISIVTP